MQPVEPPEQIPADVVASSLRAAEQYQGYDLTMDLHGCIARAAEVAETGGRGRQPRYQQLMIDAVVGSQPFGGEGLAGTGLKAGRLNHLYRFCSERAVSVEKTSAGANATLLSLEESGI